MKRVIFEQTTKFQTMRALFVFLILSLIFLPGISHAQPVPTGNPKDFKIKPCLHSISYAGVWRGQATLTVDEFLAVADQGVAGNTAAVRAYGANIDHLWATATYLNWLYSDCGGQILVSPAPPEPPDDSEGEETAEPVGEMLPERLDLTARPNPLKAETTIRLALPAAADVSLDIYDVQGRKVTALMSGNMAAGYHTRDWNGSDEYGNRVGAGVYFCRLRINGRPMLMQKHMKLEGVSCSKRVVKGSAPRSRARAAGKSARVLLHDDGTPTGTLSAQGSRYGRVS